MKKGIYGVSVVEIPTWIKYEKGMEKEGKFYDIRVASGNRSYPNGHVYFGCWFDGLYWAIPNNGRTGREFVTHIRDGHEVIGAKEVHPIARREEQL